jgi:hypothetical protein
MEGGSLTGDFEGFFILTYIWVPFLDPEDTANLSCGIEEETSVHVLCESKALASRRHAYLGSFFWDPQDVTNLSMGAIWNFGKGTGLL